jgi:hypothetical protein
MLSLHQNDKNANEMIREQKREAENEHTLDCPLGACPVLAVPLVLGCRLAPPLP